MAGTGLKAIETVYNGYRFRSRLEARWAVFYDHMNIQYQYEPQGFDLDGLWYLPDFYLPEHECWIEVKPQRPTEAEGARAARLARASEQFVYVFWGEIPHPCPDARTSDSAEIYGPVLEPDGGAKSAWWDQDHWWTECLICKRVGIHYQGDVERLDRSTVHHGGPNTPRLLAAYLAARQARFEHGETPRFAPPAGPPRKLTTDTILDVDNLIWAHCTRFQTWHTAQAIATAIGQPEQYVIRALVRLVGQNVLRRELATDRATVYGVASPFDSLTLG